MLMALGKPRKSDQIILSFDGCFLHFDFNGMSVAAPAEGTWLPQVRVNSTVIFNLARFPAQDDPLVISLEDGRICFGPTFSSACHIQVMWSSGIQLPINYNESMLLALKLKYSPSEIEQAGLKDLVAKAEKKCAACISSAASELLPFNVSKEALRKLVDQSIRDSGVLEAL